MSRAAGKGFVIPSVFSVSRLVAAAALCLLLHGCVGLGAWTLGSRTETSNTPYISPNRGAMDVRATSRGEDVKTAPELRTKWGEPDQVVTRDDGKEEWIYETRGWRWHGMVLYAVIVPIPAMIPWGTQYVSLLVKNGEIENATRADWHFIVGAYCGYFSGWGCEAGRF
ncbi:MAG TPA: hypothetical protein VH681_08930 [Nitrospiraceae bacterium]|jgi:hypothetical protein